MKKEDGLGGSSCEVIDDATGEVVGRATSKNTAAGGSTVECHDYVADGKVIRFANSRGVYAKDARPGARDDGGLPCGEGAFATDVKSCVRLDTSHFTYGSSDRSATPIPFDIDLCAIETGTCKTLVTIPRGQNRLAPPGKPGPSRWWDAKYCSDDRVLVVAEGTLRLFEAPSGQLLAETAAPDARQIVRCEGGSAETKGGPPRETLTFTVERNALRPAD